MAAVNKAQEEFMKARTAILDRMFIKSHVPEMVRGSVVGSARGVELRGRSASRGRVAAAAGVTVFPRSAWRSSAT